MVASRQALWQEVSFLRSALPTALLLGLSLPSFQGVAAAQDLENALELGISREPELAADPRPKLPLRLTSATRFVVGSDFGSADATLYWPRGGLRLTVPLTEAAALRFIARVGAAHYDFDGTTDLFGVGSSSGDPFDELYSGSIRIQGLYRLSERYSVIAEGFVKSQWEGGADFEDGISGGGGMALGYEIPERLELTLGLGLRSSLDRGGPRLIPQARLKWRITEALTLRSYGQGLSVEFALTEALDLVARARLENHTYRLDDRAGPGSRGSIRDRQIPAGLGFTWRIHRRVRITALAGVTAQHKLRVRDRDRNTIASIAGDPAPYLEIRLDLRP